jgi:hypothetical protein
VRLERCRTLVRPPARKLVVPLRHGAHTEAPSAQVRGKAMGDKAEALFELMRDVLLTAKLDDQARAGSRLRCSFLG